MNGEKNNENIAYVESNPLIQLESDDVIGIRTSKYKYFRDSINPEKRIHLYDLQNDPFENENISNRNMELVKKFEKELQDIAKDKGLTVGSEEAHYGGEIHSLVGKDDDPDNTLGFHAAPKFDDDGNETDEVQYAIELGMGTSPMYFDSKEEAEAALKKIVDDQTVRDSMDGESDPPGVYLSDLEDHVKNVLKSDDDESKPIPAAPMETKVINGVKYRAIKESKKPKKHILKENYDRFFGDK